MTLPNERANALYNALKFMQDLLDPKKTPKVPKVIRRQAYWVLRHYPREYELDKICEEAINLEQPNFKMLELFKKEIK